MMGKTHALSGVAVGLAVAPAVGFTQLWTAIPFTMLTAGYALLPDLDHPTSSASNLLWGFTETISKSLRHASGRLYERTKGSRDENWNGKHRHLTHTILFALVVGLVAAGLCELTAWSALPIFLFGLLLAADRLGDWVGWLGLAGGALMLPQIFLGETFGWQIGLAVAIGCLTHDIGDALTLGGCPLIALIWPWEIQGETWFEVRLLGPLSFRTGGTVEEWIVTPALVGGLVMALWASYLSPFLTTLGAA